mmetsp:Transcript_35926/g.87267  ORF Transcript_35926/g.87267 Transcript_35926/m.87267 type:complete len:102 (-) Transcript_35926:297-602(-)
MVVAAGERREAAHLGAAMVGMWEDEAVPPVGSTATAGVSAEREVMETQEAQPEAVGRAAAKVGMRAEAQMEGWVELVALEPAVATAARAPAAKEVQAPRGH